MNMIFPVELREYAPGTVGVFFPDVPEAISAGSNQTEALQHAVDALVVALCAYLENGQSLPIPQRPKRGQPVVRVPPCVALKLAIHQAMRIQELTPALLAKQLNLNDRQIKRLLDLRHESRWSQLEAVLATLGLQMAIQVKVVKPVDKPTAFVSV